MVYRLARTLAMETPKASHDPEQVCIRIVEREETLGPGFPHSERNTMPFHLINMCASDMGLVDGNPADFQTWLEENRDGIKERFPEYRPYLEDEALRGGSCTYVPRAITGEYLKRRFKEAVGLLRGKGATVEILSGWEAEDLREGQEGVGVLLRRPGTDEVKELRTGRALLATGHWFEESDGGRFFPSPWPPHFLLEKIPERASVGVIGTSLSALDCALTLASDGRFIRRGNGELVYAPGDGHRSITLYSRSGLLPRVRGRTGAQKNRYFTGENLEKRRLSNGGVIYLRDLYEFLDAELESYYGESVDWREMVFPAGSPDDLLARHLEEAGKGDGPGGELLWQTALHQTFSMAREIYLQLPPEDRRRFDKEFKTPFFLFASPMPPVNAEKLLALMRAGVVRVVRLGRSYTMDREPEEFVFTYSDRRGARRRDRCGYVVDARGQRQSYATCTSPLAQNLLASGTVRIETLPHNGHENRMGEAAYSTGAVWIDPSTHRVVQDLPGGSRRVSDKIYAMGVPTRGQILDASMIYSCARSAALICRDLLRAY